MSKFVLVKYKKKQNQNIHAIIEEALLNVSPNGIDSKIQLNDIKTPQNVVYGLLNYPEKIKNENEILFGNVLVDSCDDCFKLPDGSYFKLKYDDDKIIFYCDRFESKTLWYYIDNDKIIISNSQRIIVSLKQSFNINIKSISWFLSSGTIGNLNSWDNEVKKVTNSKRFIFDINNWSLNTEIVTYVKKDLTFNNLKEFDNHYFNLTKSNFENFIKDKEDKNLILPISGGNDSRLLFYISTFIKNLNKLKLINWGIRKSNEVFDDKAAAIKISNYYNRELSNEYLPSIIQDIDDFFNNYVRNSECRIDHFNAYSDNFKIFQQLFDQNYNYIIRGDIPFTEGLDLTEGMARAHIGVLKFTDFANYQQFSLDKFIQQQENDDVNISKKINETLIEWRDRLYIDFRIPIVISAFNDIINGYIESFSPMMSYAHFELYQKLKDKQKGNKNHIVRLSKKLDESNVHFNATPSIPSQMELFKSKENINYILNYLNDLDNKYFNKKLITEILLLLKNFNLTDNSKVNFKIIVKNYLSENLPSLIKAKMKAKRKINIDPLTLAYRIILIDKSIINFEADSKLF